MKVTKKQAARLLRLKLNIPARTICRLMKKKTIQELLENFDIEVTIK